MSEEESAGPSKSLKEAILSEAKELHEEYSALSADKRADIDAITSVLNGLMYYEKHVVVKLKNQADQLRSLNNEDRKEISPLMLKHFKDVLHCAHQNQTVLQRIIDAGIDLYEDNLTYRLAYLKFFENEGSSEHYMEKCRSVLRQIVRDWTKEGEAERESCYGRVKRAICDLYPSKEDRHLIKVFIPGCGLGRLNRDLLADGFNVYGNEYSIFMLLVSNFILNYCKTVDEFTIHPHVLQNTNLWTHSDALKPFKFPDVLVEPSERTFAMCAGDFRTSIDGITEPMDVIITVFFIDTCPNLFDYIKKIRKMLKSGGRWINFGPLMYHYAEEDIDSLELPFDIIVEQLKRYGFEVEMVEKTEEPSYYTRNWTSMSHYAYNSGFFQCKKL